MATLTYLGNGQYRTSDGRVLTATDETINDLIATGEGSLASDLSSASRSVYQYPDDYAAGGQFINGQYDFGDPPRTATSTVTGVTADARIVEATDDLFSGPGPEQFLQSAPVTDSSQTLTGVVSDAAGTVGSATGNIFGSIADAGANAVDGVSNFLGFGDVFGDDEDDTQVAPNTTTDGGTAQTFAYVPGGPGTPIETTTTTLPDGTVVTNTTVLNGQDPALASLEGSGTDVDLTNADVDALDDQYGLENLILNDDGSYTLLGSAVQYNGEIEKIERNWDDWRVRLSLAQGSTYLYNAGQTGQAGILEPLRNTRGIIFPYTPTVNIQYNAEYENYDLTHSNYRGYFYKGSQVQNINVNATFTAQDTEEANYMLAALHFLRSCTKMFYGQDINRGMPPPLVFLNGYGEFQFNNHPCVVTAVFYNLPNDVDYIPAGVPPQGLPGTTFQQGLGKDTGHQSWSSQITRLITSALFKGGDQGAGSAPSNAPTTSPQDLSQVAKIYEGKTYIPTKMDINFTLLPVQTRRQVSNEFSLEKYASGDLLKKGFW